MPPPPRGPNFWVWRWGDDTGIQLVGAGMLLNFLHAQVSPSWQSVTCPPGVHSAEAEEPAVRPPGFPPSSPGLQRRDEQGALQTH